jgi:putative ABC transport system permease protein
MSPVYRIQTTDNLATVEGMYRVIVSGLWARKARLFSTALAIVAGVAFMSGSFTLTDTMRRTFDDLFANAFQRAAVVVQTQSDIETGFSARPERISPEVLTTIRSVPGVAAASPYVGGYFQLVKPDGSFLGGSGGPNPEGFAWVPDQQLNPYRIVEGRPPTQADEIAIDKNSAKLGPFKVGDVVNTLSSGPARRYTIVGIMRFGRADSAGGLSVSALPPATADEVFVAEGKIDQILVRAKPGVTDNDLRADIALVLDNDRLQVETGRNLGVIRANQIKERLGTFTTLLIGFAVVSLFVGAFIITNTFAILVAQRARELALLRAIGASRRQVFSSVLAEAGAVGILGAAVGLGCGVLTAIGLRWAFQAFGINLPSAGLVLAPRTIAVAFVVGFGVTVATSVGPALRASRVPPVAAMRAAALESELRSNRRYAIGAVFASLGTLTVLSGITGDGHIRRVAIGAVLLIGAFTALGPILSAVVGRVLGRPLHFIGGQTGRLAAENAVRNPRRTATTALALTVGVAVVCVIQVFTSSFARQVTDAVDEQFSADFIVGNPNFIPISAEVAAALKTIDGVDRVASIRVGRAKLGTDDSFFIAVDPAFITGIVALPIVSGNLTDLVRGTLAMDAEAATSAGLSLGDAVTVTMPKSGVTTLRLVATVDGNQLAAITRGGDVLINTATYDDGYTEALDYQVFVKAKPNVDLRALTKRLETTLQPYPTARLTDPVQYKASLEGQLRQFVSIIYLLLALSVLIASIGIANTLTLSVLERRREIGLLRAIGAHRRQIRTMIRLESVLIAIVGAVLGLGLGVAIGIAMVRALRGEGFTQIVVPWWLIASAGLGATVLGVLAAVRPARRAAKANILSAIGLE